MTIVQCIEEPTLSIGSHSCLSKQYAKCLGHSNKCNTIQVSSVNMHVPLLVIATLHGDFYM